MVTCWGEVRQDSSAMKNRLFHTTVFFEKSLVQCRLLIQKIGLVLWYLSRLTDCLNRGISAPDRLIYLKNRDARPQKGVEVFAVAVDFSPVVLPTESTPKQVHTQYTVTEIDTCSFHCPWPQALLRYSLIPFAWDNRLARFCTFCLQCRRGAVWKLFLDTLIKLSPQKSISPRKKLAGRSFKVFESGWEIKNQNA